MSNLEKLHNAVNEYLASASDKDSVIILANDSEAGRSLMTTYGDPEYLSYVVSNNRAVSDFSTESLEAYEATQKALLNIVYNICHMNKDYRDKLIDGLYKFDIN
jgi:hypothetical protein